MCVHIHPTCLHKSMAMPNGAIFHSFPQITALPRCTRQNGEVRQYFSVLLSFCIRVRRGAGHLGDVLLETADSASPHVWIPSGTILLSLEPLPCVVSQGLEESPSLVRPSRETAVLTVLSSHAQR